jgi:DNA-binding MarR family transcriptional regulator
MMTSQVDARAKRLRITAPGLELVAKALKDVEAADASFFDGVGSGFTDSTPWRSSALEVFGEDAFDGALGRRRDRHLTRP